MSGKTRIAFIGGGNMTEALVAGLLKAGLAAPDHLQATDILPERRQHLEKRYGIKTGADNRAAAGWVEVVVLSVEPQILDGVLDEIRPALKQGQLIISVAAGYPIARVAEKASAGAHIVRAMPSTPSWVGAGVTALSLGPGVTEAEAKTARMLFESVGLVLLVEEWLMDAVTGVSGSGPAYVYLIIEALADGGVKAGLSRQAAQLLAAQTVLGAARMVVETGEHPASLKDRVASPGGTTIAGLQKLEEGRLRATLIAAVEAAVKRSKELAEESAE
jgi:pyrroline-5-carboxylate reductase